MAFSQWICANSTSQTSIRLAFFSYYSVSEFGFHSALPIFRKRKSRRPCSAQYSPLQYIVGYFSFKEDTFIPSLLKKLVYPLPTVQKYSVAEPVHFCAAPAPAFQKFRLRLELRPFFPHILEKKKSIIFMVSLNFIFLKNT
jgi:hypothetical protein